MASLYTRKRIGSGSARGMHMLENDAATSIPSPLHPVRAAGEKAE